MIYLIKKRYLLLCIATLCLLGMESCRETWDDHYQVVDAAESETLLDKLKSDPELSTFTSLLEQAGYDSILSYPQAYTVFAPVNESFNEVSSSDLNDPVKLKALLGNHICRFSYTSLDAGQNRMLKMMNGKYEKLTLSGSEVHFGNSPIVSADVVCGNGVLHKIQELVEVKPSIWDYLELNSDAFPSVMSILEPYNSVVFDEFNSIPIGKNTLGETIYDSVFVASNSYFDVIGNLDSEEEQYTFLGLPDDVFNSAFNSLKVYFNHPDAMTVAKNVNKVIVDNLVVPLVEATSLTGDYLLTTTGKEIALSPSMIDTEIPLSNGNIFVLNKINFDPTKLMYVPERFEVEESEGRKIGKTSDLIIQKKYDIAASGFFKNVVSLLTAPKSDNSNNYFEISFDKVCSAKYDIYIKFAPVGASKSTKLKYELSYSNMDGTTTTVAIDGGVIGTDWDERVKVGDTFEFPVYTNRSEDASHFVKFKVIVDVSDAELVLYDRTFGIDYVELVPVP